MAHAREEYLFQLVPILMLLELSSGSPTPSLSVHLLILPSGFRSMYWNVAIPDD